MKLFLLNKKFCISLLFIVFMPFEISFADLIHLKNGSVLKGSVQKDDREFFYIQFDHGYTRIPKDSIIKIEKEKKILTDKEELQKISAMAQTKEEYIQASEFAFNHQLNNEGIILLKRAWIIDSKKDYQLKEQIKNRKNLIAVQVFKKASLSFDSNHFRKCAKRLNKNIIQYEETDNGIQMRELLIKAYASLLSDKESYDFVNRVLNQFSSIEIDKKKSGKRRRSHSKRKTRSNNARISLSDFKIMEKKLSPELSGYVMDIYHLFKIKEFIRKNNFEEYARKSLNSVEDLNAARGNQKHFYKLTAENNKIYKARSVSREYNSFLFQTKSQFSGDYTKFDEEFTIWTDKGYEKVCGQWVTGDDIKKARGMIKYQDEWLNPTDPDFNKKIKLIDNRFLALKKKEKEIAEKKVLNSKGNQKKIAEIKKMEEDLLQRNSKNVVNQIRDALKEDVVKTKQNMAKKLQDVKKKAGQMRDDFKDELPVKAKGLPVPLGIALLAAFAAVIFISRRRKK